MTEWTNPHPQGTPSGALRHLPLYEEADGVQHIVHFFTVHFFIVLCLLLSTPALLFGQTVLTGTATDRQTGESLPFVNVRLTRPQSTKLIQATTTDTEGHFVLPAVAAGTYKLSLSYVGYRPEERNLTLKAGQDTLRLDTLALAPSSTSLGEATVVGERSTIKLEIDRKSYNVAQDVSNAGATASEALENIPSVEVDQDGSISLRGSTSVAVWINGQPSGLDAENQSLLLEQIPAESIERIEVIDNPGSQFSAEGSAGVINIVLKEDRRTGYYGSLSTGADTYGGANASGLLTYNTRWVSLNADVSYRHRKDESGTRTRQDFFTAGQPTSFQNGDNISRMHGNNVNLRGGIDIHASSKDEISLKGNYMPGVRHTGSVAPYHYGQYNLTGGQPVAVDTYTKERTTQTRGQTRMFNTSANYRHTFAENHFLNLFLNLGQWKNDTDNRYQDRSTQAGAASPFEQSCQQRNQHNNSKWYSAKLDYENRISEQFTLQAGYHFEGRRENSPQEAYTDAQNWDGRAMLTDTAYYNRFRYTSAQHSLYATATLKLGKWGIQAGLRGTLWRTKTRSLDFRQEFEGQPVNAHTQKAFRLFPTLFLTYQLTPGDQLQLSYTRRLRWPRGRELHSFLNTSEATSVQFGNPNLTPEYSHSFALNYLKLFDVHSFLLSAYYRPTTDVIQRVSYHVGTDQRLFTTFMNLSRSDNAGMELTLKNKFWSRLDLTTTASASYSSMAGFQYDVPDPLTGQTVSVSGKRQGRFVWSARIKAAVSLPLDFSVQCTGNYRSRQVITQGWRDPSYGIDLGIRKTFFQKKLSIALNCRDLLNSRQFKSTTQSESFRQYSKRWRHARKLSLTLTWNFGNTKREERRPDDSAQPFDEEEDCPPPPLQAAG